jgi:hypothetical protein
MQTGLRERLDQLSGVIAAPIVHDNNLIRSLSCFKEPDGASKERREAFGFVVSGDDNGEIEIAARRTCHRVQAPFRLRFGLTVLSFDLDRKLAEFPTELQDLST